MNRPAFLSTLPFLYEHSSNSWPPLIPEDTSGKTRRQILFRDHSVSLEPLSPDSEESLGPAYFVPSQKEQHPEAFDAAMCKAEMVLFSTTRKKTPYKVSLRTPNKSPKKALQEVEFKESVAFLLIDDRVYQVDFGKIKSVVLKAALEAGSNPPCLLLQFDNCFFRIFSLVGNDDTDQYAILNTGKNEILNILNGDHYCPFPIKELLNLTSPVGSTISTAPNSEPGQQDSALLQHETARPSSEDTRKSRSDMAVDTTIEQCQSKTQKCQTSLHAAREDLQSLRQLLKPSSSPHRKQSKSNEELRTAASGLLQSVADNVGSSFCTQEQVVTAARGLDKKMDSYRTQLDTLLKAVWPTNKRPKKRTRNNNGSSTSKRNAPPLSKDVQDASIDHVEMLLAKHKEALRSKYALAMLPTRG
ncbi:MAG: hypothetical protein SGBAC_000317 [Bacillariaceae sp.]